MTTMTDTWVGGDDGRWDLNGNWSLPGTPELGDNVEIGGSETINGGAGGAEECAQLDILAGANVTFAAFDGYYGIALNATNQVLVNGSLTLDAGSSIVASISPGGNSAPSSVIVDNGGTFAVDGGYLIADAGGMTVGGGGAGSLSITSRGTVTVYSGPDYTGLTLGNTTGASGVMSIGDHASLDVIGNGANLGWMGTADVTIGSAGTMALSETSTSVYGVLDLAGQGSGHATVTATGLGSLLSVVQGEIEIGYAGTADVTIEQDATLFVAFSQLGIDVGETKGAMGSLIVNHATLTDGDSMLVGDAGHGTVAIENHATASFGYQYTGSGASVQVGVQATGAGTLTFSGAGTFAVIGLQLDDGVSGSGTVNILDGAAVGCGGTESGLVEGFFQGASGDLVVGGAGSTLVDAGWLTVGGAGSGTLDETGGAIIAVGGSLDLAQNSSVGIGNSSTGIGVVTVSGAKTTLSITGQLVDGVSGQGRLTITDGATVTSGDDSGNTVSGVVIGDFAGSEGGALTVTGKGSTLSNVGQFQVGDLGKATFTVSDGGHVSTKVAQSSGAWGLSIGGGSGDLGAAIVTGAGSNLSVATNVVVGNGGTGTFQLLAGAGAQIGASLNESDSATVLVGFSAGSTGAVTVNGTGSDMAVTGQLVVGDSGKGTFILSGAATVTAGDQSGATASGVVVGFLTGGNGMLRVTGAGSSLSNTGQFLVGAYSVGAMTVEAGGTVTTTIGAGFTNDGADIGFYAGSNGSVEITGTGASWTIGTDLVVGANGRGTLTDLSGGSVTVGGSFIVGEHSGGHGSATIDGTGSTLDYGGLLVIGSNAAGSLDIGAGAMVAATGTGGVGIGIGPGGHGTLTVAGALDAPSMVMGQTTTATAGGAVLALDGGSITLTGEMVLGKGATMTMAGGTVSASMLSFTGNGALSGDGTIAAAVDGGTLTASGGTLAIDGAIDGHAVLIVDNGATLALGGSVANGTISFASGAAAAVQLAEPLQMHAILGGFVAGDMIEALGQTETNYAYHPSSGALTVTLAGGGQDVFHFSGGLTLASFALNNNSAGFAITHT